MYRINAAHSSYLPVNAARAYSGMPTRPRNKSHRLDRLICDIHIALIHLKLRDFYHKRIHSLNAHHNRRLALSMCFHFDHAFPVKC